MQITFDPRDPNACASVLATISALHDPAMLADVLGYSITPDGRPEQIDPAQAFDAPSPESAFPAAPFAPPAPTADIAAGPVGFTATPTSAPVAPITAETPPAPAVPAPPVTSAPSSGVELDADGLPWDARIHSGPADKRPKNSDGRWRRGRGVSDEQAAAVAAELRQVMGAPAPTVAAAPTPAPASPPPAPVAAAPTPVPAAPPPTPAAADMASGQAVAATAVSTFADLMKKVTRMQTAGLVTVEGTSEIAASLGLTGLRDLMNRPDLVPSFDALLPDEAA